MAQEIAFLGFEYVTTGSILIVVYRFLSVKEESQVHLSLDGRYNLNSMWCIRRLDPAMGGITDRATVACRQ